MLLPPDPDALPEEQEDPRAELVRRLLEYEKFKNAAQMLYQREMIENASWSNPGEVTMEASELEPELNVTLYDLLLSLRDVLKRAEQRPSMEVNRDEFSVEQMMAFLFEKIVSHRGAVSVTDVLPEIASRRPTGGCSRRWSDSTRSTTGTSSATGGESRTTRTCPTICATSIRCQA